MFKKFTQTKISFLLLLLNTYFLTIPSKAFADEPVFTPIEKKQDKICLAELQTKINAIVTQPKFLNARWGISVQTLAPNITLYSRDNKKYFIPASNLKLLTTAAVLYKFGGDFKIRTSIYGNEKNLRLVGRGDPSFTTAQLVNLVQQLKQKGYTKIDTLTVDDSYYKGEKLNLNWSWEDIFFYYGASINSLILNENTAVLTISPQKVGESLIIGLDDNGKGLQIKNEALTSEKDGLNNVDYKYDFGSPILTVRGQLPVDAKSVIQGVAIPDPVGNFIRQLKGILAREGISVKQEIKESERPIENEKEIAFVESPPLAEMLATTNLYSNNVYAESFLRTLGVDRKQFKTTEESGLNEMKNILKEIGVNRDNYQLDDGSGLSRLNLINVEAIMQTLKGISQTKVGEIYKKSLPVAGVSGTLKNRFKGTKAQGIVYAKTGTLTGASALSGYIDVPGYQTIIFSIMVNQSDQSVPEIRKAIDEIVLLLAQLQKC